MIFYLSCTGNSLFVASLLSKKINDRLVNIAEQSKGDLEFHLAKDERIGFCFPTHGWRVPLIVREFISRLLIDDANNHFCYAIITAGDTIGKTVEILQKDLNKRNIHLDSAYTIIMPETYIGLPFMDVDTLEKETFKKQKAIKDMEDYAKEILERKKNSFHLIKGRWQNINTWILGYFFIKFLITDKPFRIRKEKCSKCGKCQIACPIKNITFNPNTSLGHCNFLNKSISNDRH